MTVSNSAIKSTAKKLYKSNAISSIVVTFVLMTVWFICYNISAVISFIAGDTVFVILLIALMFFTFSPIAVGYVRYFWRICCGQNDNPISLFYYLSSKQLYFKALHLVFSLVIRTVVSYLVFSIPYYVLKLITGTWLYSTLNMSIPIWTANLSNAIGFLHLISVTATIFYMMKFYLAPMLFVADENIDIAEALHLSAVISRRTMLDFVFFAFSFIGWVLLSFLALPLLFTLPYIIASYLIHSSHAVDTFNEEIARINHDDIPTFVAGG